MYGGSQTSSKDMNLLFPSSTFKNSEGDLQRNNREVSMDVNLFHRRHHHQNQQPQQNQQQNQQQLNSGLMRYRSAPSSLLANFINGDDEVEGCDNFIPPHSSPEAETIFARFMSCAANDSDLREIGEKPSVTASVVNPNRNPQFMAAIEQQPEENGFPPASQMMFQSPLPPQPPPPPPPQQNPLQNQSSNPTDSSYRVVSSMAMDQHQSQLKMGGGTTNSSNLIRHSSSPAGLFANLTVENGYAVMRGIGNFRGGNGSNGDTTASNSRLKSQLSIPSRPPSSSGLMSQISEIESESIGGGNSGEEGSLSNGNGNNRFIPAFPIPSWDDSGLDNFSGNKRARDINNKIISGLNPSETQNEDAVYHATPGLAHHFSLPKTSAEMAAIMQFQDSVPCKIRAKRGCATHPRSIAERVRRTRISERMRKLQELVPNMDKQTNTADMLDLAVEYIKDLQKQVKTLNDNRANCTCSSKQKL